MNEDGESCPAVVSSYAILGDVTEIKVSNVHFMESKVVRLLTEPFGLFLESNYLKRLLTVFLSALHQFLQFVSRDFFVVSTSIGTVRLLQIQENPYAQFKEHMSWEFIHKFQ